MSSDSASVKALKKLARQRGLKPGDTDKHLRELLKRGARTAAILGAAILDVTLEQAILKSLRPISNTDYDALFGNEMPLGSFSAKIKLAYALRIIDQETRRNLNYIREIRNAFSHTVQTLGFRTKEVIAVINLLAPLSSLSPVGRRSPHFVFVITCIDVGKSIAEYGLIQNQA